MSVIRVAPDDHLNVRSSPAASAAVVGRLHFEQSGLRQTGRVCNVGGVLWREIEGPDVRGWVSGRFIQAAAAPSDAKEYIDRLVGTKPERSVAALAERLRAAVESEAPVQSLDCSVSVIGWTQNASHARIVILDDCGGSDAIAGRQYRIDARAGAAGWRVDNAAVRLTCHRGVDSVSGLCI